MTRLALEIAGRLGLALAVYGVYLWSLPLACVLAGALIVLEAVLANMRRAKL